MSTKLLGIGTSCNLDHSKNPGLDRPGQTGPGGKNLGKILVARRDGIGGRIITQRGGHHSGMVFPFEYPIAFVFRRNIFLRTDSQGFACLQSMKTTSKQQSPRSGSKSLSKNPVQIRVIRAKERKRFKELMGDYHYLGEGHSAGDTMRMVAERDGEWVGLLMWGSACYRLKPRDEFIGWTATQRARRQKLVVQNRRFALLAERGQHPNLASHILGAAVRELPSLWFAVFGYEPLLAETFSDIEAFKGTCYKASGWQPLGKSSRRR